MNFYEKYNIMTLGIVALGTAIISNNNGIKAIERGMGNNSKQPEDEKLDPEIMEAIERNVSQKLEQIFPTFFPKVHSNTTDSSSPLSPSLMDKRIVQAIEESTIFNTNKIVATLTIHHISKNADDLGKPSTIMAKQSTPGAKSTVYRNQSARLTINASEVPKYEGDDLTVLIVPTVLGGLSALEELERANIKLHELGVKIKSTFVRSGAVLFECKSSREKEKFESMINRLESVYIKPKARIYSNSVRLQKLPIDVREEEISECVLGQFKELPEGVQFMPYKDNRRNRLKAVIIYVGDALMQAMKDTPHLRIRGYQYDIDTTVYINRCSNCGLIGHKKETCGNPFRPHPNPSEDCIDCSDYNEQVLKDERIRIKYPQLRNVKHATDSEDCPSKIDFIKKRKHLKRGEETV